MVNGQNRCICPKGLTGSTCEKQLLTLVGNVTVATISLNGRPVNLTSPSVQDDLSNSTSQLYIDLVNLVQPELLQKFKQVRPGVDKVEVTGFRIGSLIIDFRVSFTHFLNETLQELETVFHNAINGSLLGVVASVYLTDYNECSTGTYCNVNALCSNTWKSFACSCKTGYKGNGFVCTKIETDYRPLAIGISVAFLCLLFLLFLLIILVRKRRNKRRYGFNQALNFSINTNMRARPVASPNQGESKGFEKAEFSRIPPDFFYSVESESI